MGSMDWSLGPNGKLLLSTQVLAAIILYLWVIASGQAWSSKDLSSQKPQTKRRLLVFLATGFDFALALRLSNLSEPTRVLSFVTLDYISFDPSLLFLAAGVLPTSTLLYQFCRGSEKPVFGAAWSIPQGGKIDFKLLSGAAIFGIGWGLAGICRAFIIS
ncbi:hypothetical protein H0H81_004583 [Sphagnurus paluster]|uniref:Uncharacterized protein n=1 Tax=Sphagnurus paluster TaxID=117069 RepID=A0A9P7GL92_9AGAR|nr:hypothetical protein H0H81_004583 [Sphagnurus paluster]